MFVIPLAKQSVMVIPKVFEYSILIEWNLEWMTQSQNSTASALVIQSYSHRPTASENLSLYYLVSLNMNQLNSYRRMNKHPDRGMGTTKSFHYSGSNFQ